MKLNVKFLGRCLEGLFLGLIPVMVVYFLINHLFPDLLMGEKMMTGIEELYGFNLKKLSIVMRSLVFFFGAISTAFMIYGLWIGAKIARLYSNGETLSEGSATLFIQLKAMVFCWGLYSVSLQGITSKVLMPKMPFNMVILGVFFTAIFFLLLYIVVAALSAVVTRGARLQKDQDLTV